MRIQKAGMGNHGSFEQDASISREDMGISGDAVRCGTVARLALLPSLTHHCHPQVNISMAAYQLSSDICGKVSGGLWDFDCMVQVRKQKVSPSFSKLSPPFLTRCCSTTEAWRTTRRLYLARWS